MRIKTPLSLVLGILIVVFCLWYVGLENLLGVILKVKPVYFLYIFLIIVLVYTIRTFCWYNILKTMNASVSGKKLYLYLIFGGFIDILTIAKIGDLTRSFLLKKNHKIPYVTGIVSIIFEHFLDLISLFLIVAFTFYFVLNFSNVVFLQNTSLLFIFGFLFFIIALIFILMLLLAFKKGFFLKVVNRLVIRFSEVFRNKSQEIIEEASSKLRALFKDKSNMTILVLQMLLSWIFGAPIYYFIFLSVGIKPSILIIFLCMSTVSLIRIFPLTPNNLGTYEASLVFILTSFGISPEIALTISLLDHSLRTIIVSVLGTICSYKIGFNILQALDLKEMVKETI
ncbi:lysylphosphatidylglycerol synthase transmembrane domain-containing protein [Candidatus Borrarchaeum sp.]|uniref:lysylphosphatidylglycerol synthase transmembrane domain-containing protein n=1 Tax=Candidatus Borrarchaeum sp. TaxID=2846742 RepID=UPI00257F6532|nr:lysylphosphatidylglycerol synthase transmembrane domain-containing protein [Candidatus Borrarchaeum sp.]